MRTPALGVLIGAVGLVLVVGAHAVAEFLAPSAISPDGQQALPDSAGHLVAPRDLPLELTATPGDRMAVAQPTEACATAQEVAALRQEVAQLRGIVAALRWDFQRPAEDVPPVAADAPEAQADFVALALAQEEQQRGEAMEIQESSFQREPVDPVWSSQTAWRIEDALARLAFDPNGIRDLECRATTCRLELADAAHLTREGKEPLPLHEGIPVLVMQLGDSLPTMTSFRVANGEGSSRTVFYFSTDAGQPPQSGE